MTGLTTVEIIAMEWTIGDIYASTGYSVDADKKPLAFVCISGLAIVDKITVVASKVSALGVPMHLAVIDPFPCYPMRTGLIVGDGIADDSTGLETALSTYGVEFILEDGADVRVTRALAPPPVHGNVVRGHKRDYTGELIAWNGPTISWDGTGADASLLTTASAWQRIDYIRFKVRPTRTLGRFIDQAGYRTVIEANTTAAAASTTTSVNVAAALTPGAFNGLGKVCEINGEKRIVDSNTANSVIVQSAFSTAPGVGTSVIIGTWVHGTRLTVEGCCFQPSVTDLGTFTGTYKQAITTGYGFASGNCDFLHVRQCLIRQFDDAAVWLNSGQPLGTVVEECSLSQDLRANALSQACCYGTGLRISTVAASVALRDIAWGALSVGIDCVAEARVWIDGSHDFEYGKRFAQGARLHLSAIGGRLQMSPPFAYNVESAAPVIAAGDNSFIKTRFGYGDGGSISLVNVTTVGGEDWCIDLSSNTRVDIRNIYSPARGWLRIAAPDARGLEADVTVLGVELELAGADDRPGGWPTTNFPSIVAGTERHLVTISGTDEVSGVEWFYRRPTIPLVDSPKLVATTGTPSAGSLTGATYVGTIREATTLKLTAAPGAGNSVTYEVVARPNRLQDREQKKVYEVMGTGSARRETSISSGVVAGSTWWVASMIVRLSPGSSTTPSNIEETIWCIDDNAGNSLVGLRIAQWQAAGLPIYQPNVIRYGVGTNYSAGAPDETQVVGRVYPIVVTYSGGKLRIYGGTGGAGVDATVSIAALTAGARVRIGGSAGAYATNWGIYGVAMGTGAFSTRSEGGLPIADDISDWIWALLRSKRWQAPVATGTTCTHSWRMDGTSTVVNAGTAGSAGNVTTVSGTVATRSFSWAPPQNLPEPRT